ncbi:hypothetical protein CDAR_610871, partial [Caerostris darwini]
MDLSIIFLAGLIKGQTNERSYLLNSFRVAGTIENIFPSEGQWMMFSSKWKRDEVTLDVGLEGGKAYVMGVERVIRIMRRVFNLRDLDSKSHKWQLKIIALILEIKKRLELEQKVCSFVFYTEI